MRYRHFYYGRAFWDIVAEVIITVWVVILIGTIVHDLTDDPHDDWSEHPIWKLEEKAKR
jgi:hypothetical protein